MSKENLWDKFKSIFIEEKKYKKPKKYKIEDIMPTIKNEENNNNDTEIKNLINEIINGNDQKKEDIIRALKQCEKIYFDEEKQQQIMHSLKELQNDPDILKAFIDETSKYCRFEGSEHNQIRKSRVEAIKKLNIINLNEILKAETNTYNDKKNIIKVLNSIKNEQILFQTRNKQQDCIIRVYNNIDDSLYDDVQILEILFQVFDNKMRNNRTDEIKKITNSIKRKINLYYNIEGTKEEKMNAIKEIVLPKIKQNQNEQEIQEKEDPALQQEIQEKEDAALQQEIQEKEDPALQPEIETIKEDPSNQIHKEYTPVDYASILENQEERIRNAESITEEEKQRLIDELYKEFEAFVGDINDYSKTK